MWGQRPENQQKQDGAHVSDPSSWVGGGAVHPERHRGGAEAGVRVLSCV